MWSLFVVGVGKMEVECAPWGLWLIFLPGDYYIIYIYLFFNTPFYYIFTTFFQVVLATCSLRRLRA